MRRISFLIVGLIVIAGITMAAEPFWSTKVMLGLKGQIGRAGNFILTRYEEATAPATPAASLGIIYFKADGKAYSKSATDGESDLTAGAGGGDPDQNLWETISSDSGSVAANIVTDTLTIAGGSGLDSAISGDTVTLNVSANGINDTHIDFGTGANQVSLDDIPEGTTAYFTYNNFNGMFKEPFDADVTSNGTTITMSIEKTGTGDLTTLFSSGVLAYDTTPADTIALTAGSDTSPQKNYIYILQTAPTTLVKSTSSWPAGEHIKIGFFLCQSASSTQTAGGALINQNWNDFIFDGNSQGHLSHITERIRMSGTVYFSGVDGNGGTTSYYTLGVGNTEFICTSGFVFQLHKQTFPVFDTSAGDTIHVVNWNGESFRALTELFDITADSTGTTIGNNKFFNLIIWGVINKSGEHQAIMINLPNGFYNSQSEAENDVSGFDVFSIPREFSIDSTTGFLIARTTFQMKATWVHASTVDLRGTTPQTASGGAGGIVQDFPDNAFTVFDNSDNTKVLAFDVGANITTGNTRTLSIPDASGTIVLNDNSAILTNKTIDADSNTVSNIGSAEITNDSIVDEDINSSAAIIGSKIVTATSTTTGVAELATTTEINFGTDTTRIMPIDQFEASNYGKRIVSLLLNNSTDLTTGDGKIFFRLPDAFAGWSITGVSAARSTGTGTDTFMLRNVTQAADVLSTVLTMDAGELDSNTAAVPAVIDTAQDDGTLYDRYAIDVDSVGGSSKFVEFQIEFQRIP